MNLVTYGPPILWCNHYGVVSFQRLTCYACFFRLSCTWEKRVVTVRDCSSAKLFMKGKRINRMRIGKQFFFFSLQTFFTRCKKKRPVFFFIGIEKKKMWTKIGYKMKRKVLNRKIENYNLTMYRNCICDTKEVT